jgi:hypothetical protein
MKPVARRLALVLFLAAGLPTAAQTITAVVTAGDPVVPVGNVTAINNLTVNNSGQWIVEADTDNLDTNADEVFFKSGTLLLREGQSLTGLAQGTLGSFDALNMNSAGDGAWNLFLDGTVAPTGSTDSGMFFNGTMIFQESTISTAPGFSANTPYIGFFESRINDSNQVLVIASIDDPAISSTVDRALVIINYNAGTGTYTESVLAKEGDTLPGMGAAVADFGTTPQSFGFNNAGDAIYVAASVGGTADSVYRNLTQLAMEGAGSPVSGRNWSSLGSASAALNNSGGHVYTGTLDGDPNTASIIIKNGAKFMQEGDAPPGIGGGFTLTAFGTGNIVQIADNGKVLWFGDWNDPATSSDTALFLDNQILLHEGVTQVGGLTVQAIVSAQDGYAMSPNGRYIMVEVTLTDGVTPRPAALLIDMGAPPTCYANCDGIGGLTANDFTCFLTAYTTGQSYANCDGVGGLTANDFACFLNAYTNGCS